MPIPLFCVQYAEGDRNTKPASRKALCQHHGSSKVRAFHRYPRSDWYLPDIVHDRWLQSCSKVFTPVAVNHRVYSSKRSLQVKWVAYPGLPSHPSHEQAKAMLRQGMFGGVLTFAPHGGVEAANAVIENLKLATHMVNLGESSHCSYDYIAQVLPYTNAGESRTLVVRPGISSNMMQRPSSDAEEMLSVEDMIRVSVGLESIDDIIADFEHSLHLSVSDGDGRSY